jgi:hypothetical protein
MQKFELLPSPPLAEIRRERRLRKSSERAKDRRLRDPGAEAAYARKRRAARTQAQRDAFKIVQRRHSLKKRYGLTFDQFDAMLARQGGACAACGLVAKKWHVDHDKADGHVRGLLCHKCNIVLGFLGDNEAGVKRSAEMFLAYLRGQR